MTIESRRRHNNRVIFLKLLKTLEKIRQEIDREREAKESEIDRERQEREKEMRQMKEQNEREVADLRNKLIQTSLMTPQVNLKCDIFLFFFYIIKHDLQHVSWLLFFFELASLF